MAFVLMINSFLIADEKDVNIADSAQQNSNIENAKFFEAIFGLLPNPDGEINNLAFVKLNYTANLSSSILYYSREYAKVESKTTEDGDDVQNLNSMKRRDVKLNVFDYKFHLIDKSDGTGIILSPEFNVNYYDEEKIKELNSTWDSDINPGTRDLYFERMRYNSRSLMPIIEAAVEFSFGKNFSINIGGGFLPVSFDRNHFDEFGASTEADPELQREAYYEAKYNVNFTSMGYTVKCNMQIEKMFWGSLFVDFYYLYKFGDSEVSDRWWDADLQKNIIEKYSVVDKRTIINADVFYQMDFLEFRGIIPILKFGYLNQKVTLDDEKEPVLSYDEYDFGVAVKI
jgi:hypothetical protein